MATLKKTFFLVLIPWLVSSWSASSFSIVATFHGRPSRSRFISTEQRQRYFSSQQHPAVLVSTTSSSSGVLRTSLLSDASFYPLAVGVASRNNAVVPTLLESILGDPYQASCALVLVAPIATILLAIAQGALATIRYRRNFGDAPAPRVPCHGVVLVQPLRSSRLDTPNHGNETKNEIVRRSRNKVEVPNVSDCLRLLVIGDSLAVGVGQCKTAYPVLPEEIAKELSKTLGKPVYWTCCGESGASTQWITRMLLQPSDEADNAGPKGNGRYNVEGQLVQVLEEKSQSANDVSAMDDTWRKDEWSRYRKFFDPENLRPYDVVVLVTGPNDLKRMFLPFILDEEDRQLRMDMKEENRDGGYIEDIRLFIRTLNAKMEKRVQKFRHELEIQVGKTLQEIRDSMEELAKVVNVSMDDYFDQIFGPLSDDENLEGGAMPTMSTEDAAFHTLYVLPASPVRVLPSLREMIPLRWFASPIFDAMNRKKKIFARSNSDSVLFVDGVSFSTMLEFEKNRGHLWKESSNEEVVLACRDIGPHEAKLLEDSMDEYYSRKQEGFLKPGAPGWKSFCIDGIHPRELGYTAWGEINGGGTSISAYGSDRY